jgi:hypothetical protein
MPTVSSHCYVDNHRRVNNRCFVMLEGAGPYGCAVLYGAKSWSCSLLLSAPMRWSKGGRNAMTFNEFQFSACSAHQCPVKVVHRIPAGPGMSSQRVERRSLLERDSLVRKDRASGWVVAQNGQKEGVHNVHTLGFRFGCTDVGLGRIGDVFRGGADFQGVRLVRVPPRARVFPVQGLLSL